MERFKSQTTIISAVDTIMVNSIMTTFGTVIPIEQGICGTLHMQAKLTTGSASQKYDVLASYSENGILFDDFNIANCPVIGTFNLINETATYRTYSIRLDGMAMAGKFMKIALMPSSAGAGTILANSLQVVVKSPK